MRNLGSSLTDKQLTAPARHSTLRLSTFKDANMYHLVCRRKLSDFYSPLDPFPEVEVYVDIATGQAIQVWEKLKKCRVTPIPKIQNEIMQFGPWLDLQI